MKWIKASEQLPEKFDGIIFHCKANGLNTCCTFDGRYFADMEEEYRGEDSVEWLDETTPPVQEQEELFDILLDFTLKYEADETGRSKRDIINEFIQSQHFTITKK